jgi:2-haloacid dehalogenase
MKTYQTLLFDVDNTLLDFDSAERSALSSLLIEQGVTPTQELERRYRQINRALWQAYEDGQMHRNEVVNSRFALLFREYGKEADGEALEQRYRSFLDQGHQLVEGAYELIADLKNRYDLYVVTNGVARTQDRRLRDSGLHPFFKEIFVSEDVGFQKPMKEYFDHVFARIPDFSLELSLLVGDSLSSDIRGGYLAGVDTCWYNPEYTSNRTGVHPTYEIHKLKELYEILKE